MKIKAALAILFSLVLSAQLLSAAPRSRDFSPIEGTLGYVGRDFIGVYEKKYLVTPRTRITNVFGRKSTLNSLIIRSKIKIEYSFDEKGNPVVTSITVISRPK